MVYRGTVPQFLGEQIKMGEALMQEKFYKALSHLFEFRLPICKPSTGYGASFKSSVGTTEAAELIDALSTTRGNFVLAMNSNAPVATRLEAVDKYLPHLFHLMDSLNGQEKVRLDCDMTFEWRGGITASEDIFKSTDVVFEVLMTLQTKLLHVNPVISVTEAGKHLLNGASVMDYLAANISSAIAMLFKANAQAMATIKAVATETTPFTVKARLAISVMKQLRATYEYIGGINEATKAGTYMNNVTIYLGVQRELFTALVYYCMAAAMHEKKEIGQCIGYCQAAKDRLMEQRSSSRYDPGTQGMPKIQGRYAENLGPAIQYLLLRVAPIFEEADRDNRFIYFQVTPDIAALREALPAEACIMNAAAFEEPKYDKPLVVFVYKPKKGLLGTIFSSMMGGGSGDTTKPPAAPAAAAESASAETTQEGLATAGGEGEAPVVYGSHPMTIDEYNAQTNQLINNYIASSTAPPLPPQVPPASSQDSSFANELRRELHQGNEFT